MAQRCDVCGKGPAVGNRISHAHNVTKRRWLVNLVSMRAALDQALRLRPDDPDRLPARPGPFASGMTANGVSKAALDT